jgi:hypothetical protein
VIVPVASSSNLIDRRIEHIKKAQKRQQRLIASGKQGINHTLHKVGDVANVSSWKLEILEGRRKPPPEEKSNQDATG